MVEQAFLPVPQGQTGMSDLQKNVGATHELPLQNIYNLWEIQFPNE